MVAVRPIEPHPGRKSGAATALISGIVDRQEHNEELRGFAWRGSPWQVGVAKKMDRDAHVAFAHHSVTAPLAAATWQFTPANDTPLAKEIASFCTWAFFE